MRISDWSSDVCSSDLQQGVPARRVHGDGFRWMSGPGWRWGGRRGRLVERGGVSGYRNVISRFVERIVGQFVDHLLAAAAAGRLPFAVLHPAFGKVAMELRQRKNCG